MATLPVTKTRQGNIMNIIEYTEHQKDNDTLAIGFNKDIDINDKYAKLLTGEGFACFKPGLSEPDEKGKYKLAVAFPEGSAIFKQIQGFVAAFKKEKFGDKRGLKMPLKSGKKYIENKLSTLEEEGADDEIIQQFKDNYGHLAGCWYINTSTNYPLNDPTGKRAATLLGPNLAPIDGEDVDGQDIVRIKFNMFAYDTDGNRGVALGLRACQLLKKGNFQGGDGGGDNTDGFSAVPVKDGEEESTAGLEPVEQEEAPKGPTAAEKKAAAKKKADDKKAAAFQEKKRKQAEEAAKKDAAEKAEAEEPEYDEEDDYGDDTGMTDDEVFDEED